MTEISHVARPRELGLLLAHHPPRGQSVSRRTSPPSAPGPGPGDASLSAAICRERLLAALRALAQDDPRDPAALARYTERQRLLDELESASRPTPRPPATCPARALAAAPSAPPPASVAPPRSRATTASRAS